MKCGGALNYDKSFTKQGRGKMNFHKREGKKGKKHILQEYSLFWGHVLRSECGSQN